MQELVLSNRSSAILMTDFADSEVRRNKLVSCLSKLNPPANRSTSRTVCKWEKCCPCGICVLFNSTVSLSKEIKLDDCWHHDCVLVLHEWNDSFHVDPHNTPIWVCHVKDQAHHSTFHRPNTEYAQHLACLSKHDHIELLRRIDHNLHVAESL